MLRFGAGQPLSIEDVVRVARHGEKVELAPEAVERIFNPFYTTRTTGTGLGLAIALRVVELHGGTITVGNHPDGGAIFRIAIPAG